MRMMNGHLKPAYNIQVGTENRFFMHYDFFPNPTDTLTHIPFMNGFGQRYNRLPKKAVADSGCGSEENYEYMEMNGTSRLKIQLLPQRTERPFKNNGFHVQNLYYKPRFPHNQ